MALPNTHFGATNIENILKDKKSLLFLGVGGVSMCSLARIASLRGYTVFGYDRTKTEVTEALEKDGITVYYDEDASHDDGIDAVVYTVAIPETNPEYKTAIDRGIPLISRADFLGYIMSGYGERIGISGTHGKSTTTAMTARIFEYAKRKPTVSCGAVMNDCGSTFMIGNHDTFIFEACEYMDSFLDFYPTTAVVLNVEMDHVDYFKSMEQIERSFGAFIGKTLTAKTPRAIVNFASASAMKATEGYSGTVVTFSKSDRRADYTADNVTMNRGCASFDLVVRGRKLTRVSLAVPGIHMIDDALAASASAYENGISAEDIAKGLASYIGIGRRMENCGTAKSGAAVYSDYAHHPTEIASSLSAAAEMGYNRILLAFQSHTYSRTFELEADFVSAIANSKVDEAVIADIYPARETNVYGVSPADMARKITDLGKPARYIDSFDGIGEYLEASTTAGDMILIMGAGDIDKVARRLVK